MRTCTNKNCGKSIDDKPKVAKFCSRSCGVSHNNSKRIVSEETKQKIRTGVSNFTKTKYKNNPKSILELSSRTVTKILIRMNVGCSNCGWKESTCDIHHINGRKISYPDKHSNLSILCPNCHRLAHDGKLTTFVSIEEQLRDDWVSYYYG